MASKNELIPVGVRIAAREAMVSLVLREIDDLFRSHGFTDRDDSVEGQGERRSLVEQLHARIDFISPDQARRYLELLGDVLDFVPEGEEPRDPAKLLRKALTRANLIGLDGRLRLPGPEPIQPSSDNQRIWAPDSLRLFFSHVHNVRADVSSLADKLETMHCSCFVAHVQIEPAREWQDVIESALRSCDVLIAYLTPDFPSSRWADQEVGWALGRGIPVVPVNAGLQPYGFVGSIQSLSSDSQRPDLTAVALFRGIVIACFRSKHAAGDMAARTARSIVRAVSQSRSWDSTRARFPLLDLIPMHLWTTDMLAELEQAALENIDVRECILPTGIPRQGKPAPEAIEELIAKVRGQR